MEPVANEPMVVKCSECNATNTTDDLSDFRETGTMPPTAVFVCSSCESLATVGGNQMPARLHAHLVNKLAGERGYQTGAQAFGNYDKI